jgi:hypothetical protein
MDNFINEDRLLDLWLEEYFTEDKDNNNNTEDYDDEI